MDLQNTKNAMSSIKNNTQFNTEIFSEIMKVVTESPIFKNIDTQVIADGYIISRYYYDIYKAETMTECIIAMMDYSERIVGTEQFIKNFVQFSKFLFKSVNEFFNKMLTQYQNTSVWRFWKEFLTGDSENWWKNLQNMPGCTYNKVKSLIIRSESSKVKSTLEQIRTRLTVVMSSDLVTSLRDFVLSLVGYNLFSRDVSRTIVKNIGPAQSCSIMEMAEVTLKATISMINLAEQFAGGSTFSEIFGSADPVASFCDTVSELELLKDMTYPGVPVKGKICRTEYLCKARAAAIDGATLLKSLPKGSASKRLVERSYRSITMIRNNFINQMNSEARPMPYAICITGMPGIGKGLLIDVCGMIFSAVKGRTYHESHVYHRQATEDYWSGYHPDSQPIIHYSEPGSLHKDIAAKSGDAVMSEWLSVCDNQPYSCNMADVESKGTVFAMPQLILMDCNDEKMNLDVLVNNPAAVRRRILYVTPTVKDEFIKEGSCRLDQAKALASNTPALDRWEFEVRRLEPVDNKKSTTIFCKKKCDIFELSEFLKEDMTSHINQQQHRVNMTSDIAKTFEEVYLSNDIEAESNVVAHFADYLYFMGICKMIWLHLRYAMWPEIELFGFRSYSSVRVITYLGYLFIMKWVSIIITTFLCYFGRTLFERVALGYNSNLQIQQYNELISYHFSRLSDIWGYTNNRPRVVRNLKLFKYVKSAEFAITFMSILSAAMMFKYALSTKEENIELNQYNNHLEQSIKEKPKQEEGQVLQTYKEHTPSSIQEDVQRLEESTACEMPKPRTKPMNGIDWDKPRPVPFTMVNQCTDNSLSNVNKSIIKNVRSALVDNSVNLQKTNILGLFEDFAIINKHTLESAGGNCQITTSVSPGVGEHKIRIAKSEFTIIQNEDSKTDLVLIRLRGLKFHDIRKYLCPDDKAFNALGYGVNALIAGHKTTATKYGLIKSTAGDLEVSNCIQYSWDNHERGSCGSPLVATVCRQSILLGVHCAGDAGSNLSFAQYLNLQQVEDALKRISTTSLRVNSEGILRMPMTTPELMNKPQDRSPLNYECVPGLEVFGGIKDYPIIKPGKSTLRSSKFVPYAKELTGVSCFNENGTPVFAAPPFSAIKRVENGKQVYFAPFNNFVKKAGVVKKSLNPEIMGKTINYISEHLIKELSKKGIKRLSPVPLSVAQNGHPEDFYMRAMKPSTSGGWSFNGPKRKWSDKIELDFKKDSYLPSDCVTEQVLEQVNAYKEGRDACPILGAQLKDEPRSFAKCRIAKTRVFCMSPYDATILNRMYLMPFYTLMNQYSSIFGAEIGINMHSTDVDNLVTSMKEFSDSYMEGDYGGFDTSMPYDIGLIANSIVHNVLKHFGYNDEALEIVKGILSDNLYPTVAMAGDMFAAPAFQPSGKYATAEDNSLRGLSMLVYAFISMRGDNEDFFKNVKPCIYGDDVIAAVKTPVRHFFNNCTYQSFCRDIYGLDYTNAAKTLDMVPFLEFNEISFLKRNFVFRKDLDHWVAPLDRESIMKAICYYLPSREVNVEDQMIDSCASALRELFFHHTEEEYFELRLKFAKYASELYDRDQYLILKSFPSFETIRNQLYNPIPEMPGIRDVIEHIGVKDE